MQSTGRQRKHIIKTLAFVILCLGLSLLCLRLGFWQLRREQYHRQLIVQAEQVQTVPVAVLQPGERYQNYQRVKAVGHWRPEQVFIDNQTRNGVVGYHLLQLFATDDGVYIWVDRGFTPALAQRDQLPTLPFPGGSQSLVLSYYWRDDWPQSVAVESLADGRQRLSALAWSPLQERAGTVAVPGVFRLMDENPARLLPNWRVAAVDPQKNRAYAVQWFSLSLVLLLATGWFLWHNESSE